MSIASTVSPCALSDSFGSVLELQPNTKRITIFSDGAASQFKNRFLINYAEVMRQKFLLEELDWQFFATSPGKGVVAMALVAQ